MFAQNIEKYKDEAVSVGVYDPNPKRAAIFVERSGGNFPVYTDFEEMIRDSKADTVVVTTVDAFHHEYVIRALELGCDVICEKPMTTDAQKANAIIKAEKESKNKVIVTFNCRYMPFMAVIKQAILDGKIGDVVSVHYEWNLDFDHGVSYFRRWNSEMKYSCGLQLHKSTHHFDLANWFVGAEPETVFAFGDRRFYGAENGEAKAAHCYECKEHCRFYSDIMVRDNVDKHFYYDCREHDGYTTDQCIYRKEIDIPDVISVNVRYTNRALMSYTLNTHSPYEGIKIAISGTKGRIEAEEHHCNWNESLNKREIRYYPFEEWGKMEYLETPEVTGVHGGADELLIDELMKGRKGEDTLNQAAGVREGAMSIGIGIAVNESMRTGMPVKIKNLFPELYK